MGKIKKQIRFWESYKKSIIHKGACEQIARLEKAYNRHRAKNTGGSR